jgi:hypothetical protein
MSQIKWYEFDPHGTNTTCVDAFLSVQRTQRCTHRPPLWRQPTDLLPLATPLRPSRSRYAGRDALGQCGRPSGLTYVARPMGACSAPRRLRADKMRPTMETETKSLSRASEPPKPAVLLRQHRKLRKRPWAVRKPKYWPLQHPGDLVEMIPRKFACAAASF